VITLSNLLQRRQRFSSLEQQRNLIECHPQLARIPSVLHCVYRRDGNLCVPIEYSCLELLRFPVSVTIFYLLTFYFCIVGRILKDEEHLLGSDSSLFGHIPKDLIFGGDIPISSVTSHRDLMSSDDPVTLDLLRSEILNVMLKLFPLLQNSRSHKDAEACDDDESHLSNLLSSSVFWGKWREGKGIYNVIFPYQFLNRSLQMTFQCVRSPINWQFTLHFR
jgi:hypothetical protein